MNLSEYNRIAIIGCPGSGKSTLARQIACLTGHPLIHLDYENWQPGWIALPKEEFIAMQKEWVQAERWLIDGNYRSTMEIRYAAADLVICFDLSRWLCLWRVLGRLAKPRPDLRPELKQSDAPLKEHLQFFWFVLFGYHKKNRRTIAGLQKKYPQVKFVRLRSRKAVKELLCAQNPGCASVPQCCLDEWDNPDDEVWNDL